MKALIIKTVCMFALVVLVAGNSWSQDPEQLFQKGIMKEEGEGSLREAIDLYKSVADNTQADRALRAKALYQMGSCYEKLGQQDARGVYEKLVANYTEQTELVANAKRKLNKMVTNNSLSEKTGINMRQIMDADEWNSAYSDDGKYVIYNNWDSIRLEVKNLQNGQKWAITKKGTWEQPVLEYMNISFWSPDSKQIVYGWDIENHSKKEYFSELHMVNSDGTNDRIIKSGLDYYRPFDWSPDGKYILYVLDGESYTIVLYSLDDGTEKNILTLGKRKIWSAYFSADGKYIFFNAQDEPDSENYNIYFIPVKGNEITELISFKENDRSPWVIPNTNQVVFISLHSGTRDLWSMTVENGKLAGEPKDIKAGLDEAGDITGVLNNGTILYSTHRSNPEFYYAKLDFNNKDIALFPLSIKRNPSWKIIRTIWSPSLTKAAVLLADHFINPYTVRFNMVGYDLKTGNETELPTGLVTFPWQTWIEPQWTPDEKSVLIKARAQEADMKPRGIFKFDFSSGKVDEYATQPFVFSGWQWQWLQFSPDGKTQYFASRDSFLSSTTRLISKSIETDEEKVIAQFDKEIKKFFLSPDGKSIAVKYENELQIFHQDNPAESRKIEIMDKNWGTILGWTNDSKSVLVQKPAGKDAWAIWIQPLDGQESMEAISADKLKPFFGASELLIHNIGNDIYLSMQYGKQINELWAIENIAQK